jgi:hypothetical protein
VIFAQSQALRIAERLLEFAGEFVHSHDGVPLKINLGHEMRRYVGIFKVRWPR